MKEKARLEAVRLRKELGLSIKEIARKVGAAASSASKWVQHVELTEAQKEILRLQNPAYNGQAKGAKVVLEKFEAIRNEAFRKGQKKTEWHSPLFLAGCMLYWGEGSKANKVLSLSNNDPRLLRLFIKFLQENFAVEKEQQLTIRIKCYTDVYSLEEIEEYWLKELELPHSCLRKGIVNYYSSYSKKKNNGKSPYGTCTVRLNKGMDCFWQIMGAIDKFSNL
jgi:transposase-like protein